MTWQGVQCDYLGMCISGYKSYKSSQLILFLKLIEKDYDRISVLIDDTKKLNRVCRRINKLTKGAVVRAINSDEYEKKSCGEVLSISFPGSITAKYIDLIKWVKPGQLHDARKAGVNLAKLSGDSSVLIYIGSQKFSADFIVTSS